WAIDITVLGRAERPVKRAGARPGDGLWVSGTLGGARAALGAWQRGQSPSAAARASFAHPMPRIAVGLELARAGATAMLDLSDGLAGDAVHIAEHSGVAIEIDLARVPRHPDAPDARFAALGGEDYELLAAMPAAFGEREADGIASRTGVALARIGVVLPG